VSVVLGEHEREDAGGLLVVGRVFGSAVHRRIVQIHLPIGRPADDLEVAEIAFAMRVVLLGEVAEASDFDERVGHYHVRLFLDARRHGDFAA
jgi:hypothetical protein